MSQLRVHALSMSLDGYVAGPNQSLEDPLGVGGERLHEWVFETRALARRCTARTAATTGVDDRFMARGFEGIGANDHGPQHVRPDPRALGARGRGLARLVGRRTALPHPGVRAHAPRARARSRWRAAPPSTS